MLINAVGYQTIEKVTNQKQMGGTMFAGVASEAIPLSAISIREEEPDGTSILQIYDPKSNTFSRYHWNLKLDGEDPIETEAGLMGCWCDMYGDEIPEGELPSLNPGQGYWLTISKFNADPATTISGALYTTDTESEIVAIETVANVKDMHSNPMPTGALNLGQISVQEEEPDGTSILQIYDPLSNTYARYHWNLKLDGEDPIETEEGLMGCWCDMYGDEIPSVDLPNVPAGQGFWFTTSKFNTDPALKFPNPLYTEK